MHPDNQHQQPEHQNTQKLNNAGSNGELNAMALAGFLSAFVIFPLGLVFSIIGLRQIKRTHERGRELAITGAIISGICCLAIPVGIILALTINTSTSNSSIGIQAKVRDTERKADIKALQSQLEEYYKLYSYYPTLDQINSFYWLEHNMPDLVDEATKDPGSVSFALSETPAANTYSYEIFPKGCDNTELKCDRYIVTATFESGGTYVINSLDNY